MSERAERILLPGALLLALLGLWSALATGQGVADFPGPRRVALAFLELSRTPPGARVPLLASHVIASVFRVTWGFLLAALMAIPLGLLMGWHARVYRAVNPLVQILRPISPIAWIPIAILLLRHDDPRSIFLIFISSFFPIVVATAAAVQNIPQVYLRSAANFGCSRRRLFASVVLPAALPQILTGLRIAVGVAWLVVVAAEMVAIESGLGYLIIDARNAGGRYDLIVAAMLTIGVIGLLLDTLLRRLERLDELRWGYASRG
jgi:NitT/TauT family transport system permease protein